MKQSHQSVAMAGLLAVALAISGCAALRGDKSSGASGTGGSTGTSGHGAAGSSGSGTSSMQDDRGGVASTAAAAAPPNSTVLAIESLPAAIGITEGDASMGASGAAGATGSSGQSYRVTVRMDDGSTQVVTHNSTPDFRSGDRVNVTSGAIQR